MVLDHLTGMPRISLEQLGAVFDWDGVIIDSHDQHEEAWAVLADEIGKALPEGFFRSTFGMRNEQIIPDFTPWAKPGEHAKIAEIADRKEAVYREIVRRSGIEPLQGVKALLETLNTAGVPCSVGSSTPLKKVLPSSASVRAK